MSQISQIYVSQKGEIVSQKYMSQICQKYITNTPNIYLVPKKVRSLWEGEWPGREPASGLSLYGLVPSPSYKYLSSISYSTKNLYRYLSRISQNFIFCQKKHLPIFTQSLWVLTFSIYRISHIHFLEYPCFFVCNGSREPRVVS